MKTHPQPHGTAQGSATDQNQRFYCPCGVAGSFLLSCFLYPTHLQHIIFSIGKFDFFKVN
jgi:hypothetical protein